MFYLSIDAFMSSSPFCVCSFESCEAHAFVLTGECVRRPVLVVQWGLIFVVSPPPRYFLRHQPMRIEECTVLGGSTEVGCTLCTPLPVCCCARALCLPLACAVFLVPVHVRNVKCFLRPKSCYQLGESHLVAVPTDCWLSAEGPHRCVRQPGQFVLLCATPSVRTIDCG